MIDLECGVDTDFIWALDDSFGMTTTGDGDCLLHAIGLSLCGCEDTDKRLRQLLLLGLSSGESASSFQMLWRTEELREDTRMGFPGAREAAQIVKDFEQCVHEAAQPGV
jgi:hypothetical protein